MAVTADKVIVEFEARLAKYNADMANSAALFEKATNKQARQIQYLERQIQTSSSNIGSTLKGLAGGFAAAFSVSQITAMADSFTRLTNSLKVAGLEGVALKGVQDQLLAQSQKYGVNLETLAKLYGNVSMSANELGASQADLVKLTEYTAQALKISGTSTEQASGAILGLNQALASGRVQMEEFNQMNEGGLRPLLQAAANTEQFGGSVAKLRAYMADTGISGAQFYQMIIAGSAGLETQANKAVLTLSGGFEALKSSITVFLGEADQVNGVSAAMGQAMVTLSQNLDVLANALAVIAIMAGGRYTAGMVAATRATLAKRIADVQAKAAADSLAASQARANTIIMATGPATTAAAGGMRVATGATIALTAAGRSLLALFGGPLGLAITAVTLGLGYMATESANTEAELMALEQRTADTAAKTKDLENRMREAGIQVKNTGQEFTVAKGAAWDLGGQLGQLVNQFTNVALSARDAELAVARFSMQSSAKAYMDSRRNDAASASSFGGFGRDPMDRRLGINTGSGSPRLVKESPATKALRAQFEADRDYYRLVQQTPTGAKGNALFGGGGSTAAPVSAKSAKARKGAKERVAKGPKATGPSRAELDARAASEQRQLDMEILALKKDEKTDMLNRVFLGKEAAVTEEDRARIANEILALERAERQAQLDANKDLTKEQRKAQQASLDQLYGATPIPGENVPTGGLKGAAIEAENDRRNAATILERRNKVIADGVALIQAQNETAQAELAVMLDTASTKKERYDIESQMLMLDYDAQRAAIENSDLDEKIKEQKRRQLNAETQLAKQQLDRAYESPLQSYARDVAQVGNNLNDTFDAIAVDGLESLNDGITDAIMGAKSLGDVFSNVAKQIIADLIRIAVQQMIIKPLLSAAGVQGFNSGGAIKLPGFASGGSMLIGGRGGIDKNVLSMNGQPIARVSRGEHLSIVNPALTKMGGGGGVTIHQHIDARDSIASPDFIAWTKQTARAEAARAGAQAVKVAGKQAPAMVAKRQRYGA